MKVTKRHLKNIIKEEITKVLNEENLADLVSSALEKVPDEEGTEYRVVRNVLTQLARDPSEETMQKVINLAGTGRSYMLTKADGKIVDVSLTARIIGHPLLNAVATELGLDHPVFQTSKGRGAKDYMQRMATDFVPTKSRYPIPSIQGISDENY